MKTKILHDNKCKMYNKYNSNSVNSHEVVTTTVVHRMKDYTQELTNETTSKKVRFCTDVTVFHYRYKKLSVYRRLRKMIRYGLNESLKPFISIKDG